MKPKVERLHVDFPVSAARAAQLRKALAAPDLLRALKALVMSVDEHNAVAEHVLKTDCRWRFSDALPAARAAIAKAEGP